MNLDGIAEWCGKYWPVVVSVVSVAAGGTATWKNVLDVRRGNREDAAKRAAALLDEEHRRWTDAIVQALRERRGTLAETYFQVPATERDHVDWAVRNRRLKVRHQGGEGSFVVDEAMPK